MRMLLAAAILGLLFAPHAAAHSTYEAAELELHVLDDEGSDSIELYGGYDIQDVFAGFAHQPQVGDGPSGDGVYLRIELYGDRSHSAIPQGQSVWSITVNLEVDGQPLQRTIRTTDGASFESDFDLLLFEVEGRDTHIQRAFLAYAKNNLTTDQTMRIVSVESRVDGDLRDVAPGGIPVPGTNGLQEYPDPLAIPGQGFIVDTLALQRPEGYFAVSAQSGREVRFTVTSSLKQGEQHVYLLLPPTPGYDVTGKTVEVLGPGDSMTFVLLREPGSPAMAFDILSDLGGRMGVFVDAAGNVFGATSGRFEEPAPVESPAAGVAVLLVAIGLAYWGRRQ
jgi:hypothetical protein